MVVTLSELTTGSKPELQESPEENLIRLPQFCLHTNGPRPSPIPLTDDYRCPKEKPHYFYKILIYHRYQRVETLICSLVT